ncbi:hypothetical protein BTUL_0030g00470 [Botrytis tulipae]|uniref:Uncharacterized protein n=1 Tax=Botrytis tulipae TaxID=87230 RepID=A0A4Z1EZR3_9HELO|nr:hypothetical protein BTUL_0030g00470 [Botrytis tulipae]
MKLTLPVSDWIAKGLTLVLPCPPGKVVPYQPLVRSVGQVTVFLDFWFKSLELRDTLEFREIFTLLWSLEAI